MFTRFLSTIGSFAFLFAVTFDYGLTDNWTKNRTLVEQRVRLIHTDQESNRFFEDAYNSNLTEIGKFVNQVALELRLYPDLAK